MTEYHTVTLIYTRIDWHKPLHLWVLQLRDMRDGPSHSSALPSQTRVRCWSPPPHSMEHSDQLDHSDQTSSPSPRPRHNLYHATSPKDRLTNFIKTQLTENLILHLDC